MPAIVITRDIATCAQRVADGVARGLGISIVYRDVVARGGGNAQASLGGASRHGELFDRLLHGAEPSVAAAQEVCDFALRGDVVVCGAGLAPLLSGVAHVVRVHVRTTMALRVKRMMACMEIDDPQPALQRVLASDARCAAGHALMFGIADREHARFFDLVVDTGRDGVETCVDAIAALAAAPRFQATADSRAELKTRLLRLSAKATHCGTPSAVPESAPCARSALDGWLTPEPSVTANHALRIAWLT